MVTKRTPAAIMILEPAVDLRGIEVVAVGMAHRDVDRADLAALAPGDADAADIAVAPRPGRAAIGLQARVVRLGVERDDAHTAQIGQLLRGLPIRGVGKVFAVNTHQTPPENEFVVMESTTAPKIDAGSSDAPRVTAWRIVSGGTPCWSARLSSTPASRAIDWMSFPVLQPSMKTSPGVPSA